VSATHEANSAARGGDDDLHRRHAGLGHQIDLSHRHPQVEVHVGRALIVRAQRDFAAGSYEAPQVVGRMLVCPHTLPELQRRHPVDTGSHDPANEFVGQLIRDHMGEIVDASVERPRHVGRDANVDGHALATRVGGLHDDARLFRRKHFHLLAEDDA